MAKKKGSGKKPAPTWLKGDDEAMSKKGGKGSSAKGKASKGGKKGKCS